MNTAVPHQQDEPHWKTVLQNRRVYLVEHLHIGELMCYLIQNNVVLLKEKDGILLEPDPSTRWQFNILTCNHAYKCIIFAVNVLNMFV